MKKLLIGSAIMAVATYVAYAMTCTYTQVGGGWPVCITNAGCVKFQAPVAVSCIDTGKYTGNKVGPSFTNNVNINVYTNGTCNGLDQCTPGTLIQTLANYPQVETYCAVCGSGN